MNTHTAMAWDNIEEFSVKAEHKHKEYINFVINPLALVISMLESGKDLTNIVENLNSLELGKIDIKSITEQHIAQADTIYKYFSNKHTLRRLKNQFISTWMSKVEDLCNSRQRINKDLLTVLVTLPRFYKENRALETLMQEYKSFPDPKKHQPTGVLNQQLTFVKKIQRKSASGRVNDYYWRTENNQLVRIRLEANNLGSAAWEQIAKNQTIRINSEYNLVKRIQGYDFYVMEPTALMEIVEIGSDTQLSVNTLKTPQL